MPMKNITESLAGMALYFEMPPLTCGKIDGVIEPQNFFDLWNGGLEGKDFPARETITCSYCSISYRNLISLF